MRLKISLILIGLILLNTLPIEANTNSFNPDELRCLSALTLGKIANLKASKDYWKEQHDNLLYQVTISKTVVKDQDEIIKLQKKEKAVKWWAKWGFLTGVITAVVGGIIIKVAVK